jgi:hypothetical protein
MSTIGLLLLTLLFAYLTYDSLQFRRSSQHRVWADVPPTREKGVDHLAVKEQESLRANLYYIGSSGFPGLHWVLALITFACAMATMWSWLG